jgi:hypothetical protein
MRGTDIQGNSANFVETEQIVEFDQDGQRTNRVLTSFLQTRGSIPLYWSQRPNLKWQPQVHSNCRVEKDCVVTSTNFSRA